MPSILYLYILTNLTKNPQKTCSGKFQIPSTIYFVVKGERALILSQLLRVLLGTGGTLGQIQYLNEKLSIMDLIDLIKEQGNRWNVLKNK